MDKIEIDMYVSKFRKEMNFHTKKQEYDFKTKMNTYAKRDTFNITYELFKLCIEKDKQLENKPIEVIEEVKPKSEKDILLDYQQQLEDMPTKYTKPTHMEEFHDVVDKMETYLCDIEENDETQDLVDEVYDNLCKVSEKIINKFSVTVDDWTYWGTERKKFKDIYSPQSYQEYIKSIDDFILHSNGASTLRMTQYKQEILKNKELKQLLKSFKG